MWSRLPIWCFKGGKDGWTISLEKRGVIRYDGDRTEVVVLMFILITGIFEILMQISSIGGVFGVLRLQGGFHSLSGHMLEGRFLVVIISSRKVFLLLVGAVCVGAVGRHGSFYWCISIFHMFCGASSLERLVFRFNGCRNSLTFEDAGSSIMTIRIIDD